VNDDRRDLQDKIRTFLPQLRLGLDIGQSAGGIAIVEGNKILHAETYTDYHNTTLEDRRRLRRGRRTRQAKRIRLARLRSWILRQKAGGRRLPDPYDLMHRKRFQCQPGEYGIGQRMLKRATGREKAQLGSWVDAVGSGRASDQESFVIALTQLFQKRGFRWDGSDLRDLTDDELREELERVHLTDNLAQMIRAEVDRRKKEPEAGYEGGIPDFDELLRGALTRPRLPRTPQHRSFIEDDLRRIVKAFCEPRCPDLEGAWADQLIRRPKPRVKEKLVVR